MSRVNAKRGADFPLEMQALIESDAAEALAALSRGLEPEIPVSDARLRIPYRNPGKVWCIGLNYRSHAEDLSEVQPEEPGSFMKPSSCFLEPGGAIELPPEEDLSREVDAEGELALVFGKRCRDVPLEDVRDVLFGYTTALGHDRAGHLGKKHALPAACQELRHVLFVRTGHCHHRRDRRRWQVGSPDNP